MNVNALTKEELKSEALIKETIETRLPCTNHVMIQVQGYSKVKNESTMDSKLETYKLLVRVIDC